MSEQKLIRIMCPNLSCQRILAVPVNARGKLVRCKSCTMTIRIPNTKSVDPVPPAEADEQAA